MEDGIRGKAHRSTCGPRHAHVRARAAHGGELEPRASVRCLPGARRIRARTRCHARPARLSSGLTPPARRRRVPAGVCAAVPHPLGVDVDMTLGEGRARRAVARAGLAAVTGVEPERRLSQREAQRHGNTPRTSPSGRAMPLWSQALSGHTSSADRSAAGRRHCHGGKAPGWPRSWRRSSRAALDCARAPPVCLR
jgi:hypothetical protein